MATVIWTAAPDLPTTAEPAEGKGRIYVDRVVIVGGASIEADSLSGDYLERELLVSGAGAVYRYGETTDHLEIARHDVPYTTRMIVRRPRPGAAFSGTVVLEIAHPEVGVAPVWPFAAPYLRANGHAHVVVTTLRDNLAYGTSTPISKLKAADPIRYQAIEFDEGGLSWDVIAQVAALLRSRDGANPLADLDVRQVLVGGYSGAGAYTLLYVRSFHERWRQADGSPLIDGYLVGEPSWYPAISMLDDRMPVSQGVTEVDVPVISLYTGPQAWMDLAVSPDTDRTRPDRDGQAADGRRVGYRTYEIAGGAHLTGPGCGMPRSDLRLDHVFRLCLDHLRRWTLGYDVPPRGERVTIHVDIAAHGRAPRAVRDDDGNVLGGLRSTFVDVPRASYRVCRETRSGIMQHFSAERLVSLYGDKAGYVTRVGGRAAELVAERWLLLDDAAEVIAMAESVPPF